jgi:hypothetical protein
MSSDHEVVWSGRDSLLPDRAERLDSRMASMPSLDLDEGEVDKKALARRPYNRTGKFVGICSRTNPNAKQYKPWTGRVSEPGRGEK